MWDSIYQVDQKTIPIHSSKGTCLNSHELCKPLGSSLQASHYVNKLFESSLSCACVVVVVFILKRPLLERLTRIALQNYYMMCSSNNKTLIESRAPMTTSLRGRKRRAGSALHLHANIRRGQLFLHGHYMVFVAPS